jgi:diketogulonate reductase-like aldo/keto reductase
VDSYILHGPASNHGLNGTDWEVWRAMENLQKSGSVKLLGVSNISFDQLELMTLSIKASPS